MKNASFVVFLFFAFCFLLFAFEFPRPFHEETSERVTL